MRFWLCALGMLTVAYLLAQPDKAVESPIRRVVIYKDGNCLTEREVLVEADQNPVRIENALNALMGGVWATVRHKTAQIVSLQARMVDEKRMAPPANLAELLLLNDGKRVAVSLVYPDSPQPSQSVQTERYEGVLRVFKPSITYEDAYPTADPLPDYVPTHPTRPASRWDWYSYPITPPDYVQDRFSRVAQQATFAVETANGLVMFTPAQVKQIEFGEPYVREREVVVKRPLLEISLSGVGRGERVPVHLYAIERGIRWIPEYRLALPTARASEATLTLSGVLINELQDLQDVEATVAVGAIQFMMQDHPSPLGLRETFRKLSRWFGGEPPQWYPWYTSAPRVADVISAGGFGGFAPSAPSAPGMGIEQGSASASNADSVAFLELPRISLPKNGVTHIQIRQQKLVVDYTHLWVYDLTEMERGTYTSGSYGRRSDTTFTTLEDLAYRVAQERRFRNEVYEAIILRNTGNTPWTTAPITVLRGGSPVGQDVLLFTPPGDDAFIYMTPATRISVACSVQNDRDPSGSSWTRAVDVSRATIRVQNLNEQPVRLMARVRFVGHFKDATREPKRVTAKTVDDTRFWDWYYRNRLQMNPYTEIVWDVEVPPGISEWQFRYERRNVY